MSNIFLIYVSNKTDLNDNMLVRDIAIESMQSNRAINVSGILMAIGNYFLQVLEGEEEVVDKLLAKISQDQRHKDIRILYRGAFPDRIFGQWSMGCIRSKGEAIGAQDHFVTVRNKIEQLRENYTQEASEQLRGLIVSIPKLIAEDKVHVD